MLPLSGQPRVHCSITRIRLLVGLGRRSKLPTPKKVLPKAASTSIVLLIGDNHVACTTSRRRPSTPTASGETRCGSESPGVAPVHVRHSAWASQKTPSRLRRLACHVTRALALSNVRSEYARRSRSGAYNQRLASPAFRL